MKRTIVFATILTNLLSAEAWAQGAVKGTDVIAMDRDGLQRTIEGNNIKLAMMNYLESIGSISDDPKWRRAKLRLGTPSARKIIADDIWNSSYAVGGAECRETFPGAANKAWTRVGSRNSKICFDLEELLADYRSRGLDSEKIYKELAKTAFHEHIHHLQERSGMGDRARETEYESEANEVGSYVWWTAVSGNMPTLRWSEQTSSTPQKSEASISGTYFAELIEKAGWVRGRGTFLGTITDASYVQIQEFSKTLEVAFCDNETYEKRKTCKKVYLNNFTEFESGKYGLPPIQGSLFASGFYVQALTGKAGEEKRLMLNFPSGTKSYWVPLRRVE